MVVGTRNLVEQKQKRAEDLELFAVSKTIRPHNYNIKIGHCCSFTRAHKSAFRQNIEERTTLPKNTISH